jgi:ribonuclease P protein subunit POP4
MKNKEILIGRRIKIVESPNRQLVGISGKVVDETKNTLILRTKNGDKRLIKKQIKIQKIKK